MLQSIIEYGMRWHASLLRSFVEHNERPGLAHARRMIDKEHIAWRHQRREACLVAKPALSRGRRLSMERDSKKRSYYEMSAEEQQLLEDFDVRRLQKQVDKTSTRVENKAFRCSLQPNQEASLVISARPAPSKTAPRAPHARGVGSTHSSH